MFQVSVLSQYVSLEFRGRDDGACKFTWQLTVKLTVIVPCGGKTFREQACENRLAV